MFEKLQKKLMNVYIFLYLPGMKKHYPKDFPKAMDLQEKRVRALVKRAYEVPFYRERFERAGIRPEDIRTGEDLVKLPMLTKDELREWMSEESRKEKYKNWIADTTSGSTGKPLTILFSPREKAYMKANWMRVMMCTGYNPFFGKTMSRINAHDENAGGRDTFLQRFGILRRKYVDQYAPEAEVIDAINEYKPDWLYMNKTEMMRLVLYSSRTGKKIFHPFR